MAMREVQWTDLTPEDLGKPIRVEYQDGPEDWKMGLLEGVELASYGKVTIRFSRGNEAEFSLRGTNPWPIPRLFVNRD